MAEPEISPIICFYSGGTDHRGRTLEHILAQDDAWLEQRHDFIQWLFPLPEASPYNEAAPRMQASDIAAFAADPALRARLLAALSRMLAFYGFDQAPDTQAASAGPRLAAGRAHWLAPRDHNFLRLTRILRCLHLLGCPDQAAFLLSALEALARSDAGRSIGAVTLSHWRAAARGARLA